MVGISFNVSVLEGYSSAVISHDEVLIDDRRGRWSCRDLTDIASVSLDVREGLATFADVVEDESDLCGSDGVVGEGIGFKLIALDLSNGPAVEGRSLAEVVLD